MFSLDWNKKKIDNWKVKINMSNVELKQLGSEYLQSPQCPKLELVKLHASNKCKIQKNEQCMLILMNNVIT